MRNRQKNKKLKTNEKIFRVLLFLAFLLITYIGRLFSLQIIDKYNYKEKGNNVSLVGRAIKPERGNIYDRNGNPLAVSQRIESLYMLNVVSEEESKKALDIINNKVYFDSLSQEEKDKYLNTASLAIYKEEEISKIAKILKVDEEYLYNFIKENKEDYIYKSLTKYQKDQLQLLDLPYLLFLNQDDRYYPNHEILSNTLGFVESDGQANYGLEKYYDEILSGKEGYREFFKALRGTEIPYTKDKDVKEEESKDLRTSINIEYQKIVHEYLTKAVYRLKPMYTTAILSNPNNGEILAIESLPSFDANEPRKLDSEIDNMFLKHIKVSQGDYLLSKWNNRAVSNQYEPGSTYKTITAALALETNPDLANKVYQDNGYYQLAPGVVIRSWRYWDPHGPQNLREAFKNSSNPVFVQLAKDIGKEDYVKYAKGFRFGQKSGIDLPNEVEGNYPKDANINDVDFGTLSYGHYLNVNPVQLVAALNSVVNGGKYYKPHIGQAVLDKDGKVLYEIGEEYKNRTISESTSKEINEYMNYTATEFKLNTGGYEFGAKTGTTVKYKSDSIFDSNNEYPDNIASLYVTYPADKPELSLLVIIDEPLVNNSSTETISMAKGIMEDILSLKKNEKNPDEKAKLVRIPDLNGQTVEEAKTKLDEIGLDTFIESNYGKYHIVNDQYPAKGNMIEAGSTIELKTDGNIRIPNLIDMDIDEALSLLENNNIPYEVKNNGKYIESQSIESGEVLKKDSKLIITSKEKK